MEPSISFRPSASNSATLMKGWSTGQKEMFGSLLFCNYGSISWVDTEENELNYPRIRHGARLNQNNSLKELDGGEFDTSSDSIRPDHVEYARFTTGQGVPCRGIASVCTSITTGELSSM